MSLFPAYANQNRKADEVNQVLQNSDWLTLNSFDDSNINQIQNEFDKQKSEGEAKHSKNKSKELSKVDIKADKRKKRKHDRTSQPPTPTPQSSTSSDKFRIDKRADRNNFAFNSLYFKDVS